MRSPGAADLYDRLSISTILSRPSSVRMILDISVALRVRRTALRISVSAFDEDGSLAVPRAALGARTSPSRLPLRRRRRRRLLHADTGIRPCSSGLVDLRIQRRPGDPEQPAVFFFFPVVLDEVIWITCISTSSTVFATISLRVFPCSSGSAFSRGEVLALSRFDSTTSPDSAARRSTSFSSSRTFPGQSYCRGGGTSRRSRTSSLPRALGDPVEEEVDEDRCMSSRRSRSGGQRHRDHVDAVEQVLPDLPWRT